MQMEGSVIGGAKPDAQVVLFALAALSDLPKTNGAKWPRFQSTWTDIIGLFAAVAQSSSS